jgi:hypothetical protein
MLGGLSPKSTSIKPSTASSGQFANGITATGTLLYGTPPTFTSGAAGIVPASGGGTTNFLRADGSWAAPSGGGGGFTASNKSSSFTAVAQNMYYCSATLTCTLPTAVGVAGQEIVVILTGSGTTITFNTTSSQTISGQASGVVTATAQFNAYRFSSDGSNWYLE